MTRNPDLTPLMAALDVAARRHADERRRQAERDLSRLELALMLGRFGLPREALAAAVALDDASQLPTPTSQCLRTRIRAELSRLARLARRGDPRYDVIRHMAVMRLSRWLEGSRTWSSPDPGPGSGRSRNQRFRRTVARRPAAGSPLAV